MGLHHLSYQALLKWVNEWQADYYVIIAIKNNIIMIDECLTLTIISKSLIKNLFIESVWYFKDNIDNGWSNSCVVTHFQYNNLN